MDNALLPSDSKRSKKDYKTLPDEMDTEEEEMVEQIIKNKGKDYEPPPQKLKRQKTKTTTFHQEVNDAWINFDIDLTDIDTKNQTFTIHARINVFWLDANFIDGNFKKKVNDGDDDEDGDNTENDEETKVNFNDDEDDEDDEDDASWKIENVFIHSYSYDEFREHFPSYRLPLNVNKLFCNALEIDKEPKEEWRIWINPQTKDLHTFLEFKGTLIEHLECDDFPFDAQFLNIHLYYDTRNYNFLPQCPFYVYLANDFGYQLPITVKKFSSIVQWKILSPWLDLRKKKEFFYEEGEPNFYDPNVGLIKLRVQREPWYYLLYTVFPLILIIATSFAVSSIDPEDIGDRLGYLVTLLLTIAAFQYSVSEQLPESPTLTNVDKFILSGYFIESLFILYVSVSVVVFKKFPDFDADLELILPVILAILWAISIILYVIYPYIKYKRGVDWREMSDSEYHEFDIKKNKKNVNVKSVEEGDIVFGSTEGGVCTGGEKLRCLYFDERLKSGKRLLQIEQIDKQKFDESETNWDKYTENKDKYNNQSVPRPWERTVMVIEKIKKD